MKDYYGKTYRNKVFSNAAESIKQRLSLLASDARNLCRVVSKRPLVIPAVLMMFCCFISYYLSSWIPSVVTAFAVLACFAFISKRVSVNKNALLSDC